MAAVKPTIFRWPLDDFEERLLTLECGEKRESDDFSVEGVPNATFRVWLYTEGMNKTRSTCGAYLHVRDFHNHPFIRLKFEFWFKCGKKKLAMSNRKVEHKFDPGSNWGFAGLVNQTELVEFAKDGPLALFCTVTPVDPIDAFVWAKQTGPSNVLEKIAANFDSEELADVQVRVPGKAFKVSKLVICSGSRVFRERFSNGTKEKETGVIELTDEADVMELLLRYLYSGKVVGLKDAAARLLPIADCYEVLHLAEMCLGALYDHVSVETAVRDLKLAFAHDHKGVFKQKFVEFAKENFSAVKLQPDWTPEFVEQNAKVVMEIMALLTN